MDTHRVDLVVPVYNEKENFLKFYNLIKNSVKADWRLLIVYDMPNDNTLDSVAPLAKKDSRLKTVFNPKRGVINALKAGFENAEAEAVFTMMVDDPPEVISKIDEMVEVFYKEQATVVAASRYMKGGGHHGGPRLKGLLSRLAGMSLYYLIQLPIHDATYNTKIYRGSFLKKINIESQRGFEVALELTIKAHLAGEKLVEIPVVWKERVVGQSRFKLLKWLPAYLRWYSHGLRRYWIS